MPNQQITPEQAEAYVRERWEEFPIKKEHDDYGPLCLWKFRPDGEHRPLFDSYPDAVLTAYAYTKERERKIAELKYELSLQRLMLENFDRTPLSQRNPHDHDIDRDAIRRTIGRLEAELADLIKGFKEVKP